MAKVFSLHNGGVNFFDDSTAFHILVRYTLLQIHFYSHKEQFLSVDCLPHSSIHVRNNAHISASVPDPDVSDLQFLNQLIQSISK